MKLDGEKLIERLDITAKNWCAIASDYCEDVDVQGELIAASALDATNRIIKLIKSGDYTIDKEGEE